MYFINQLAILDLGENCVNSWQKLGIILWVCRGQPLCCPMRNAYNPGRTATGGCPYNRRSTPENLKSAISDRARYKFFRSSGRIAVTYPDRLLPDYCKISSIANGLLAISWFAVSSFSLLDTTHTAPRLRLDSSSSNSARLTASGVPFFKRA